MVRIRVAAAKLKLGCAGMALALAMVSPNLPMAAEAGGGGATAAPAPAPAPAPADVDHGLTVFQNSGCSTCHALKAAGAEGSVGPSFDGNAGLSVPFVVDRVTNGQGAMPSFGGQLTDKEIADVAAYVVQAAAK